jgi:hypothetical protein
MQIRAPIKNSVVWCGADRKRIQPRWFIGANLVVKFRAVSHYPLSVEKRAFTFVIECAKEPVFKVSLFN